MVTLLSGVADQKRNQHSAIQITLLSIFCTFKFFSVSAFLGCKNKDNNKKSHWNPCRFLKRSLLGESKFRVFVKSLLLYSQAVECQAHHCSTLHVCFPLQKEKPWCIWNKPYLKSHENNFWLPGLINASMLTSTSSPYQKCYSSADSTWTQDQARPGTNEY